MSGLDNLAKLLAHLTAFVLDLGFNYSNASTFLDLSNIQCYPKLTEMVAKTM